MRYWSPLGAHARWIAKLREFIYGAGDMDVDIVGRDDQCELGRWIYGVGARFRKLEEYRRAKEIHQAFHRRAVKVVTMVNRGQRLEAAADLAPGGELRGLSVVLANAFATLNRKILAVESAEEHEADGDERARNLVSSDVAARMPRR
jgi:hypothetical protein